MIRVSLLLLLLAPLSLRAAEPSAEGVEFFEKKIRPALIEHCYKCHSAQSKQPKGGVRLDSRAGLIQGGDSGPSLVPGDVPKSKLIEAIHYKNNDLLMPPKGKLPDAVIADIEAWVKLGAPWPSEETVKVIPATKSVFDLQKRKAEHWAWQPVQISAPPVVKNSTWPRDPVDQFILSKLETKNLTPAAPKGKLVWLRRVTFALTGLPPTPEDIAAFEADRSTEAFAKVVDRLLASPQYGERWGRHWLDLVRYAESRGHEFDPNIANAFQYRDYVVRALNADVPYDQFVREHLAGDVLPKPRLDLKTGSNESVIGTGFWHLGEEVHSPVDIRQDQADRYDNRIDVMTKSFLAMTVSCARCHDHKFDAISTKDYYALFGLLEGSSYRQVRFDTTESHNAIATELKKLRDRFDGEQRPNVTADVSQPDEAWRKQVQVIVDYSQIKPEEWLPDDVTFGSGPRPAGFVSVRPSKDGPVAHVEERTVAVYDRFWDGLKLARSAAHDNQALAGQPRAGFTIRTPNFTLKRKTVSAFVRGGCKLYAAVCGHTVIAGPLHAVLVKTVPNHDQYQWVTMDLSGYVGQRLHLELTATTGTDFAVAMVVQGDDKPPTVPEAVTHTVTVSKEALQSLADEEKALAAKVNWQSRLTPALWDANGVDEAVFVRGNPRSLGEVVPVRSLEALAGPHRISELRGSGRAEFAWHITDPKQNPLVARVAVNRIWHHLFGRGIVASTDNFGVLGDAPTHPELLDYLATEFVNEGWHTKKLIRRLVLSSTYRMSSEADANSTTIDPTNQLLHHFRLKRLEGEAIRDTMLSVSGRLDSTIGGPPVPIFLTPFLDGRGRPTTGPLDGNGRRSLYLSVRRNFLSPFLLAYDTPIPFSTVGRRQVSNVPAQALILMNDPFVHGQAETWAKRILAQPDTTEERVTRMYLHAFGRTPTLQEVETCRDYVTDDDAKAWTDLAHTLFNVKEFVFVP